MEKCEQHGTSHLSRPTEKVTPGAVISSFTGLTEDMRNPSLSNRRKNRNIFLQKSDGHTFVALLKPKNICHFSWNSWFALLPPCQNIWIKFIFRSLSHVRKSIIFSNHIFCFGRFAASSTHKNSTDQMSKIPGGESTVNSPYRLSSRKQSFS